MDELSLNEAGDAAYLRFQRLRDTHSDLGGSWEVFSLAADIIRSPKFFTYAMTMRKRGDFCGFVSEMLSGESLYPYEVDNILEELAPIFATEQQKKERRRLELIKQREEIDQEIANLLDG